MNVLARICLFMIFILLIPNIFLGMATVRAQPAVTTFELYRAIIPPHEKLADILSDPFCPLYGPPPEWLSPTLGITEDVPVIFLHIRGSLANVQNLKVSSAKITAFIYEPNGTWNNWSECSLITDQKENFEAIFPLWAFGEGILGIWKAGIQVKDPFTPPHKLLNTTFTVGKYLSNISIRGLPTGAVTGISVDGLPLGEAHGTVGIGLGWLPAHTLSVEDVSITADTRYHPLQSNIKIQTAGNYTFEFAKQYLLRITTQYPMNGSGWYNVGETITLTAPTDVELGNGSRAVFRGWTGVSGTNPFLSFVFDGPKNVVATYETQYYLKVISPLDDPKGEGWYDQGAVATFSVAPTVGNFISQVFAGWTGDFHGSTPTASMRMDNPKTVTATWRTDYTILMGAVGMISAVAVGTVFLVLRKRRNRPS